MEGAAALNVSCLRSGQSSRLLDSIVASVDEIEEPNLQCALFAELKLERRAVMVGCRCPLSGFRKSR